MPENSGIRPAWMLWIMVDMFTVLVLSGSTEPGLWQVTQYCVSLRRPPA